MHAGCFSKNYTSNTNLFKTFLKVLKKCINLVFFLVNFEEKKSTFIIKKLRI